MLTHTLSALRVSTVRSAARLVESLRSAPRLAASIAALMRPGTLQQAVGQASAGIPDTPPWLFPGVPRLRRFRFRAPAIGYRHAAAVTVTASVMLGTVAEMRSSRLQAWAFATLAGQMTWRLEEGAAEGGVLPAPTGPSGQRLGYARIADNVERATGRGWVVAAQARASERMRRARERGFFPTYEEKDTAGLRVLDRHAEPMHDARFPARVYMDFEDVPPLVWQSLLFIENRELLDPSRPRRNPAVEWDRLGAAVTDRALGKLGLPRPRHGASTLATQLEKVRHSPGGRTDSAAEKLRQMLSASLRSYQQGEETLGARRRIVVAYLNSLPLAGIGGHGEVVGLGDGLWHWYGVELDTVNAVLREEPAADGAELPDLALAYRQVLSLLLAQQRPSHYLPHEDGREALRQRTNVYLHLLADARVVSPALRDAALIVAPQLRIRAVANEPVSFVEHKAVNAVRVDLLQLLGAADLHALDKMDVTARTTYDQRVQAAVAAELLRLKDPAQALTAGLYGPRLLGPGDPELVDYALVVFERTAEGNAVRVQADTFEGPFDVNRGAKLELGSTAKLRVLVHYLEVVEQLHERYAGLSPEELRAVRVHPEDRLTAWAVQHMAAKPGVGVSEILEAALQRRYSASPQEAFFTGGTRHTFRNFDGAHNAGMVSVREAFRHSINLPFVRLLRDLVRYHLHALPGAPAAMLDDPEDPRRQAYLARHADQEGRLFLWRFWQRYRDLTDPQGLLEALAEGRKVSAQRLLELHERPDLAALPLADRAHLAGVHPLELWLVHYLREHPEAGWQQIVEAGEEARREAYRWLFRGRNRVGQDRRIRVLLEQEAFAEIHRAWARLGYPFDALVPSYATAVGSSGDRPAALAELVGIVLNDGVHLPSLRLAELHLAEGTPYETVLRRARPEPQRLLSPEAATAVREALVDVVEHGTARRALGAVPRPDGTPAVMGAKTGTGDNRLLIHGAGGQRVGSRTVNRTATLVFFLDDRLFGVLTTYVSGPEAASYTFTSSLPAQLLKVLGPTLAPLLDASPAALPRGEAVGPPADSS